jgi:hypothetical protein
VLSLMLPSKKSTVPLGGAGDTVAVSVMAELIVKPLSLVMDEVKFRLVALGTSVSVLAAEVLLVKRVGAAETNLAVMELLPAPKAAYEALGSVIVVKAVFTVASDALGAPRGAGVSVIGAPRLVAVPPLTLSKNWTVPLGI